MRRVTFGACAAVAFAGVAGAAEDYTHVRTGSEPSHLQLLNSVYGGGFSAFGTATASDVGGTGAPVANSVIGYSSTNWIFARVQDRNGSSPLNLNGVGIVGAQDTGWADGVIDVRVTAKVAGDSHTFGWYDDASASGFQAITPTVVGNTVDNVALSTQFRWGLDTSSSLSLTSRESDNPSGQDMMVTYAMYYNTVFYGWLLAWEDRIGGDFDYNDAWIEIALVNVIPTPLAAGMGSVAMGGLLMLRRRR